MRTAVAYSLPLLGCDDDLDKRSRVDLRALRVEGKDRRDMYLTL